MTTSDPTADEQDQGPSAPGPAEDVVRHIEEAVRTANEASELRRKLAELSDDRHCALRRKVK